jgi:hypothetical protein
MEVKAKGFEHPVTLYEVLGIGKPHKLYLLETTQTLLPLAEAVSLTYEIVEANHIGGETYKGALTRLSPKGAEVLLEKPVPVLSNLKIQFVPGQGQEPLGALYAKVVAMPASDAGSSIRFTSSAPEVDVFLSGLLSAAAAPRAAPEHRTSV